MQLELSDLNPSVRRALRRRLKTARDLIEQGWAKRVFARRSTGEDVSLADPDATCFCALGAVQRALIEHRDVKVMTSEMGVASHDARTHPYYQPMVDALTAAIQDYAGDQSVATFNDRSPNRQRVLHVFDQAVEVLA